MDVRESWQVRLSEEQMRRQATNKNDAFRKRVRAQQAVQQMESIKLRLAAFVALVSWVLAGVKCFN